MYHVRSNCSDESYSHKDKKRDASGVKFDGDIAANSDKNEANQRKKRSYLASCQTSPNPQNL